MSLQDITDRKRTEERPVARLVHYDEVQNEHGDHLDTVCLECCAKLGWEDIGTPVYHVNIYPYRAVCHECDRELIPDASPSICCLFGAPRNKE